MIGVNLKDVTKHYFSIALLSYFWKKKNTVEKNCLLFDLRVASFDIQQQRRHKFK